MSLVIFPKDNKGPPCFAELQFKKCYPSVPLLNLDSKGLTPAVWLYCSLHIGMGTSSVRKAKIGFWKALSGTEQER